jgi:hypothetical protein
MEKEKTLAQCDICHAVRVYETVIFYQNEPCKNCGQNRDRSLTEITRF